MEKNIPVPLDGYIQHHPVVQRIITGSQLPKAVQFRVFQLRHKPHGADIHTEDGNPPFCRGFCRMQNGSIAAEANQDIRSG